MNLSARYSENPLSRPLGEKLQGAGDFDDQDSSGLCVGISVFGGRQ